MVLRHDRERGGRSTVTRTGHPGGVAHALALLPRVEAVAIALAARVDEFLAASLQIVVVPFAVRRQAPALFLGQDADLCNGRARKAYCIDCEGGGSGWHWCSTNAPCDLNSVLLESTIGMHSP